MENHVYLYIRYSHEKQGEGSSYDRQLGLALNHFPDLIRDDDHIFFDKGQSAYKGKHLEKGGQLRRFYDLVAAERIPAGSTLLVEDLDRLSREHRDKAGDLLRQLTRKGITVYTLRDHHTYKGDLSLPDSLTALIKQELSHEESAKKGSRVADSYVKRYARARAGEKVKVLLPSWVGWVSKTEYKLKEHEAEIVNEIFTMAANGWSYAMICKELNQRGIKPFRGKEGALWITASVSAIIKGRAAIGEYAPNDGLPPIPNYFPPAVTVELFEAAQGARALRKGSGVTSYNEARFNVWSKVALCAKCKRPYHCVPKGESKAKGRTGQFYLVCSGKFGGTCTAKNVPAKRSEEVFVDVLMDVVKSDYFVGDQTKELAEIQALTGRIDAEQAQKRILEAQLLEGLAVGSIARAIDIIDTNIARMTEAVQEKQLKLQERDTVERSRAAIRAKIDLESRDGRIEANSLLKGLGIVVEIGRSGNGVSYTVFRGKEREKLLVMFDDGESIKQLGAYSKDVAIRIHELDDTLWPELAIDKPFKNLKRNPPSTEPVPNWGGCEDYPYVQQNSDADCYEDEYTVQPGK